MWNTGLAVFRLDAVDCSAGPRAARIEFLVLRSSLSSKLEACGVRCAAHRTASVAQTVLPPKLLTTWLSSQHAAQQTRPRDTHRSRTRSSNTTMRVTVQPRLQTERWSLYWKEPSRTDTACLPPLSLELDGGASIAALMQQVRAALHLRARADERPRSCSSSMQSKHARARICRRHRSWAGRQRAS